MPVAAIPILQALDSFLIGDLELNFLIVDCKIITFLYNKTQISKLLNALLHTSDIVSIEN